MNIFAMPDPFLPKKPEGADSNKATREKKRLSTSFFLQ
jgi:hypothetical protein